MKRYFTLILFLLFSASVFAQLSAVNPGYRDTTKYRQPYGNHSAYTPLSKTQDSIFVFFDNPGKLSATQAMGQPARFTWQKLDTAGTPAFKTFWVDSLSALKTSFDNNTSYLPDSVGYGCYRVATDTLQGANLVAADTFTAWVIIDSFYIDSISILKDCNELMLTASYLGSESGFHYSYLDLWRTPNQESRSYPDEEYIKKVLWDSPVDIHKDAEVENGSAWKSSGYITFVPTPLYDAHYTVSIENYFGQKDTISTPVITAISTYAKIKMFVSKTNDAGVKDWEEKTDESAEDAPTLIYLANASINASSQPVEFTWSLFSNKYERPENDPEAELPLLVPQIITGDSGTVICPDQYDPTLYQPGQYPIALYVKNEHGCTSSDTVMLEVDEFLINKDAIPTVFTPNGDGINDVFKLKDPESNVKSLESFEISIFNRYGQLMFRSRDVLFGWDGKMGNSNTIAPDGVYFYVVKAHGYDKYRRKTKQTIKSNIHLFNGK